MYPRRRRSTQTSVTSSVSHEFILPEGRVTPNALFVGGIYMKVEENEMRDVFAKFGSVEEVKLITYRGGVCKGYGFVYFSENVDIQSIIKEKISFKGRTLKLGPAILKERRAWSTPSQLVDPQLCTSSTPCMYYSWGRPMEGHIAQPSPVLSPYNQPYPYSSFQGIIYPQMSMNYSQTAHAYQHTSSYWMADQVTHPVNQSYVNLPYNNDNSSAVPIY